MWWGSLLEGFFRMGRMSKFLSTGKTPNPPSRENAAWVGLNQYMRRACERLPRKGKICS